MKTKITTRDGKTYVVEHMQELGSEEIKHLEKMTVRELYNVMAICGIQEVEK